MHKEFSEFELGQSFVRQIKVTKTLLNLFGELAQDFNPLHVNEDYAKQKGFQGRVAYGNILGLMISALVGESLKESQMMLINQSINYKAPVFIEDDITLTAKISDKNDVFEVIELKLEFRNQENKLVAKGKCQAKTLKDQ